MIRGKSFYDRLPVWVQSVAVDFVSAKNFRLKYGKRFHEALMLLERNERCSKDQLLEQQHAAIRALLTYAQAHVPYYRRLGCSAADLSCWPILDKQTVSAHSQDFLSDEVSLVDLMINRTSGTTGTPLEVRYSVDCHQMEMAFRWRHKAWGGVPFLSRGAYLSGHPVIPPHQTRPPFCRVDHVEKRLLCSSYHLTQENLPHYAEALMQYRPDFVHGYPSSLYLLAQCLLEQGIRRVRPRAVFCASETLLDFQRETIEAAFDTQLFNWYGNSEMTCNIVQCSAGNLHYRLDYGVLELLDDGTMICTGLNNRAMPFIRYRVGDVAQYKAGECSCGCTFPLIERVVGRVEDYIYTPDGRMVGRLDHLLKDATHVREAQIVQKRIDEVIVRIVRSNGYTEQEEKIVEKEARLRLGSSIKIQFEYVDTIHRTANGKFRFVVREIGNT